MKSAVAILNQRSFSLSIALFSRMSNSNDSSYATEVLVFAHYLGIKLDTEGDLIYIAWEALNNLPPGWEYGVGEGEQNGIPYFHNLDDETSQWDHPEIERWLDKVKSARASRKKKKKNKAQSSPVNQKPKVEETMEIADVEDFDNEKPMRQSKDVKVSSRNSTPAFGLSNDDFLDNDDGKIISLDASYQERPAGRSSIEATNQSREGFKAIDSGRNKNDDRFRDIASPLPERKFDMEGSPDLNRNRKQQNQNQQQSSQQAIARTSTASAANSGARKSDSNSNYLSPFSPGGDSYADQRSPSPERYDTRSNNDRRDDRRDADRSSGPNSSNVRSSKTVTIVEDRQQQAARPASRASYDSVSGNGNSYKQNSTRMSREEEPIGYDTYDSYGKKSYSSRNPMSASDDDRQNTGNQQRLQRLGEQNRELEEDIAKLQARHDAEVRDLKEHLAHLEEKLQAERQEHKTALDKSSASQGEFYSKLRDMEDAHEIKLRDALRKCKIEGEEELREKLKAQERKHLDELDTQKIEYTSLKRRWEDAQKEVEALKRKIFVSKEDGKLELISEMEGLKTTLREHEEKERQTLLEMRKLRDEVILVNGKLASAMQANQILSAELEAAKQLSSSAITDSKTQNVAMMQATHKLQMVESDAAQIRAENLALRKELDARNAELRKLQGTAGLSGDRLNATEQEARRMRTQYQGEISRLNSRIMEIDAENNILREQVDKALDRETMLIREKQRVIDQLENDCMRQKDRLHEYQQGEEILQSRIVGLEREIMQLQETVFRKDRSIQDESRKQDSINVRVQEVRRQYEGEIEQLNKQIAKLREEKEQSEERRHQELQAMQADCSIMLEKQLLQVADKIETQWGRKNQKEKEDLRNQYEYQLERQKQEFQELHVAQLEKSTMQKLMAVEEKTELEQLRHQNKHLRRVQDSMEVQIEDLHRELRQTHSILQGNSAYFTPGVPRQQSFTPPQHAPSYVFTPAPYPPPVPNTSVKSVPVPGGHAANGQNTSVEQPSFAPHGNLSLLLGRNNVSHISHVDESYVTGAPAADVNQSGAAAEHGLSVQTLAMLNSELSSMKQRLHAAMADKPPRTASGIKPPVEELEGDWAPRQQPHAAADDSFFQFGGDASQHQKNRVKFSPEALFTSPVAKKLVRNKSTYYAEEQYLQDNSYGRGKEVKARSWLEQIDLSTSLVSGLKHQVKADLPDTINSTFEGMSDGGFYEGYWKSKYGKKQSLTTQ